VVHGEVGLRTAKAIPDQTEIITAWLMMDVNKTCISCLVSKPRTPEHFFFRNKAKGWVSSWCKDCRKLKRDGAALAELAAQRNRRGNLPLEVRQALRAHLPPPTPRTSRLCADCGIEAIITSSQYCPMCAIPARKARKKADKCIYKSRLRKATPIWADKSAIKEIYNNIPIGMDVDHIIPIRGKLVSGLHVEGNLQYLPKAVNMRKSNHYSLAHDGRK
jgi:hypothetical protein